MSSLNRAPGSGKKGNRSPYKPPFLPIRRRIPNGQNRPPVGARTSCGHSSRYRAKCRPNLAIPGSLIPLIKITKLQKPGSIFVKPGSRIRKIIQSEPLKRPDFRLSPGPLKKYRWMYDAGIPEEGDHSVYPSLRTFRKSAFVIGFRDFIAGNFLQIKIFTSGNFPH